MALDNNLITKFKKITRYDLQRYLLIFEYFGTRHSAAINSYYGGISKRVPEQSLKLLDNLAKQAEYLDHIIKLNARRFDGTDWWDLLELLEDIKTNLHTHQNSPKWHRVSRATTALVDNPEIDIQLKQGQTIERLAGGSLGYADEHQDWYDLAIKNDLAEEDYTPSGGVTLQAGASGGLSFEILDAVDVMDAETMKGKDICKKITWEDNDIKVLKGDESFLQDMEILATLVKGDNPEFVKNGLSAEVAVGQNISGVSYPVLTRQLNEVFGRNDLIDNYSIVLIERREDGLFLELEIHSKSKEIFNISTTF